MFSTLSLKTYCVLIPKQRETYTAHIHYRILPDSYCCRDHMDCAGRRVPKGNRRGCKCRRDSVDKECGQRQFLQAGGS